MTSVYMQNKHKCKSGTNDNKAHKLIMLGDSFLRGVAENVRTCVM
jgi:hypothetical protein